MPKKEKLRNFHRQEILKSTYELCSNNSMASLTMREVSKRSQYTLRTLYRYFKSKEELLYELLTVLMEEKGKWLFPIIEKQKSPLMKIFAYIYANFRYLEKFPAELKIANFCQAMEYDLKNVSRGLILRNEERRLRLYSYFERLFEDGIKRGYFKEDLHIAYTQNIMTETFRQVNYLVIVLKSRPEDYFLEYKRLFLRSIITDLKENELKNLLSGKIDLPEIPVGVNISQD